MATMRIRCVRPDDAEGIAAIYAPFVINSAVSFEVQAPSPDEVAARITEIGATYPWLVVDDGDSIAGYAYASRHSTRAAYQWAADVTVYLDEGYHRRGIGKRLYRALFSLLRQQGFRSLYAGITLPNDGSIGLHRAMGMSEVGIYKNVGFKLGQWRDVIWFGISFEDDQPPMRPPTPFKTMPADTVGHSING
jgi:L-amino acid N-acyltransferase YncA